MDWFLWEFGAALSGLSATSSGSCEENMWAVLGGCAEPTALDMWLVQVAYEVVAAESRCAKCGSPLGRGLLLAPSSEVHPLFRWRVSIATRCSGWRRHRHVANVVKASNDLLLGSLHLG